MRVIGGEVKGRKLSALKGDSVRPTTDRVKESLFNILRHDLEDAEVLDLFAGTGSLGMESLSRGAARCVFVDKAPACVKLINKNLEHVGFQNRAEVYHEDAGRILHRMARKRRRFSLVFMDPPYKSNLAEKALSILAENNVLEDEGIIVIEHHYKKAMPEETRNIKLFRQEKYGDTSLSFFRYCPIKNKTFKATTDY